MTSSGNVMAVVLQITLQLQVPSQGWYKSYASQCEIINGAFAPGDVSHLVFSALTTCKDVYMPMDCSTPMLTQAALVKLKGPENKHKQKQESRRGGVLVGKSEIGKGGKRSWVRIQSECIAHTCMKLPNN